MAQDALNQYQKQNGLSETATLDQATTHSLLETGGFVGSSTPPSSRVPASRSGRCARRILKASELSLLI